MEENTELSLPTSTEEQSKALLRNIHLSRRLGITKLMAAEFNETVLISPTLEAKQFQTIIEIADKNLGSRKYDRESSTFNISRNSSWPCTNFSSRNLNLRIWSGEPLSIPSKAPSSPNRTDIYEVDKFQCLFMSTKGKTKWVIKSFAQTPIAYTSHGTDSKHKLKTRGLVIPWFSELYITKT